MGHTVANTSMATGSVADLAHTFSFGIEVNVASLLKSRSRL